MGLVKKPSVTAVDFDLTVQSNKYKGTPTLPLYLQVQHTVDTEYSVHSVQFFSSTPLKRVTTWNERLTLIILV